MKTRGWLVAAILCILMPFSGMSQCSSPLTISYDTTVSGLGSNGDDPFVFTFSMFDGNLGTLGSVNISSEVTVQYNYDIENNEANPKTFRLKLARYDDIYSPALSSPLSYNHTFPNSTINPQNATNYYSNPLTGTDSITSSGPDYSSSSITLLNNAGIINTDTVNVAPFIGAGNVSFEYYTTVMPAAILNSTNTTFHTSATDQITFRITYTYCQNIILNSTNNPRITRTLQTQNNNKYRLFPNPSINGNFSLQFHNSVRGDWQVEVFNSGGQLISQKKFNNVTRADVNNANLSKGIYIIKSTNTKTREIFVERLLVK